MKMQRIFLCIVLAVLVSGAVQADTLYLRNGSVLQGVFLRYENGQFVFQLMSSDGRSLGSVQRYPARDVIRVITDRDPDATLTDNRSSTTTTRPTVTFDSHPQVDVRLEFDWINSNIQVRQGQKVKVEATGQISLDGRTSSTPAGINRRDPSAWLPNDNDGALIASIGNELSSPIILIGKSKEFEADRDGILYFTVNHWEITNTRGSYKVSVQTERMAGGNYRPAVTSSTPFSCGMPERFTESESGYDAVWTRRGNTNEYDAVWSRNGRREVTAVLSITTQGNRIYAKRLTSSDGYQCEYEGTVGNDGVTINGTARCGSNSFPFQARAECNR